MPTDTLRATNFGFSSSDIPSDATINGIEIVVCKYGQNSSLTEYQLYLRAASGQVGNNLKSDAAYPTGSPTETTYGGATNMCGTTLTQANIVESTFGFDYVGLGSSSSIYNMYVDYIKIRVYYTASGGSTSLIHPLTRKPFKHMIVR